MMATFRRRVDLLRGYGTPRIPGAEEIAIGGGITISEASRFS
jgi:hypothetical protein